MNTKRARFVIFLKILLDRLQESGDFCEYELAKFVVLYSAKRNRLGDTSFSPLVDVLERRLRVIVGEAHWKVVHTRTQIPRCKP
jgi:hypothetical protein